MVAITSGSRGYLIILLVEAIVIIAWPRDGDDEAQAWEEEGSKESKILMLYLNRDSFRILIRFKFRFTRRWPIYQQLLHLGLLIFILILIRPISLLFSPLTFFFFNFFLKL